MARPMSIVLGQIFDRLTVIDRAKPDRRGRAWFKCKCVCGNFKEVPASELQRKNTKSCGCLRKEIGKRSTKDINGTRFGRLVALYPTGERRNEHFVWRCLCDCGRETEVTTGSLGTGRTRSCGCLRREFPYRHGGVGSPLYKCWTSIKARCLNPKNKSFKDHGGRGITIASEWIDDFQAFRDYINQNLGPRPKGYTLDRIENSEGYFPGNLRWAPRTVQAHNSRGSRVDKAFNAIVLECTTRPTRRRRHVAAGL